MFLSGNFPPIYSLSPPLSFSLKPNTGFAKCSPYVFLRQGIGFSINVTIEKPLIDLASLER